MRLLQIILLYILFLSFLSSCKKNESGEYKTPVFAGIYNDSMLVHEFIPPFQIPMQIDTINNIKSGIDSIDIDLNGSYDFLIQQRINLNWNDNISRGYLEEYNFPFIGIRLRNSLEVAYKIETFPTGLGSFSSTQWVDTISYGRRIDQIREWHDSNMNFLSYKGYYNKTIWMSSAPPGSAWWGSYGYWHQLSHTEMYIGIRMKIESQYKYGWIKVKVISQDNFEIISYAIEK